ncbi:unnamed protein product [Cuscuta campestris]|uniref:Uncharacterized protein n=1 Tax=Cuscuta campestris TaxID=132261 RepID=A0A484KGU9_9ASTE|nr:unnamed protein product [Cuscuta campestris]
MRPSTSALLPLIPAFRMSANGTGTAAALTLPTASAANLTVPTASAATVTTSAATVTATATTVGAKCFNLINIHGGNEQKDECGDEFFIT